MVLCQSSPLQDRNLCIEVVVPHLWGHLEVTVVRVKAMVIVVEVIVRGQVVCRKILSNSIRSEVVNSSLIEYPAHFLVDRAVDLLVVQMPQGYLQTVSPFNLRMLVVRAEPTLVVGPKYQPKVNLTSGNVGTLSLNITQS
jgi:hypothetical protein